MAKKGREDCGCLENGLVGLLLGGSCLLDCNKFISCSVVSNLGQLVGVRSGIPGEETFVMSFQLV